jgi:Protein of unknown function (DUF3619)
MTERTTHFSHGNLSADQQGARLAAHLFAATQDLPHEVSERLRAARVRAVSSRKTPVAQPAFSLQMAGAAGILGFGDEGLTWRGRLASALPLLALVAGLVVISMVQQDNRAHEIADVDAALLVDDLPPGAYSDPGFAQFLKTAGERTP